MLGYSSGMEVLMGTIFALSLYLTKAGKSLYYHFYFSSSDSIFMLSLYHAPQRRYLPAKSFTHAWYTNFHIWWLRFCDW